MNAATTWVVFLPDWLSLCSSSLAPVPVHLDTLTVPEGCGPFTLDLQPKENVRRSKEELGTSMASVPKSKNKCELQITEDLEEFVDMNPEKNNETGENAEPTVHKPTKQSIPESKPVVKSATMKKKLEPKTVGPMKEEESAPWNGITLNRCLIVAAFAALISMGFQVLQDVVEKEDELSEIEVESWTPPDPNEQLPDPWFFEGWFGSSEVQEIQLPEVQEDQPVEDEAASIAETPSEPEVEEMTEHSQEKVKQMDQWGMKSKSNYMEIKASKIRRAPEDGVQKNEVFPFMKRPKQSTKPEVKDKLYKEKEYKRKGEESKFEHPKKQEGGKPDKKGREEQKKYFKQEEKERYKARKEDNENKGYKSHQKEKEYRKLHDSRHHG
ncbi:junctional sarcoplasmic reticulum protein 1 [Rhinophrynus dorsalis]